MAIGKLNGGAVGVIIKRGKEKGKLKGRGGESRGDERGTLEGN